MRFSIDFDFHILGSSEYKKIISIVSSVRERLLNLRRLFAGAVYAYYYSAVDIQGNTYFNGNTAGSSGGERNIQQYVRAEVFDEDRETADSNRELLF